MSEHGKHKEATKVLDGADINQDIHQLIGYVWNLGNGDDKKEFPSSHCCELAEEFLRKHRPAKVSQVPAREMDGPIRDTPSEDPMLRQPPSR